MVRCLKVQPLILTREAYWLRTKMSELICLTKYKAEPSSVTFLHKTKFHFTL